MLGLLRPEAGAHLGELHVARGKIVEHDEAADRRFGLASVGIEQRMRQHEAKLQLVVERARVGRHCDVLAVRRERQVIAHVVDRLARHSACGLSTGEGAPRDGFVGGDEARRPPA